MDLRGIMRTLYGVEQPKGCTDEEINAIREIFGAIPAAVEEFWRTVGHVRQLNQCQDEWILPQTYQKWSWPAKSDYLILLNENQSVCWAGIRREDLTLPDPPVYTVYDPHNGGAWELSSPTTSEFLEAALLYEGVWQTEYCPEEFYWLTDEELAQLQAGMEKHPIALHKWFDMEITFYHNRPDNLVVVMDVGEQYQCIFGAATEESYLGLMDVMEGLGEEV